MSFGDISWTDWLPGVLQLPVLYYTVIVCIAAGYFCRALPKSWQAEPVMPVIVLIVGQLTDFFLVPTSHVYALGCGLICSMISIACYPLFLNFLESKLRALLGIPQAPSSPSTSPTPTSLEPLQLPPKP